MTDLRIVSSDLAALRASLLVGEDERCAVLLVAHLEGRRNALLVREVILTEDSDYSYRSSIRAELLPEFVARVTKRAKLANLGLVFVHTHPGQDAPSFSRTDDEGERELAAFMVRRGLSQPHGALVLSEGGICARTLGTSEFLRVVSVGKNRTIEFDPAHRTTEAARTYDRQVRAFGA
jgi:hypothetical protein